MPKVCELQRQLGQRRYLPGSHGFADLEQVVHQHAGGPAIKDDVMQAERQQLSFGIDLYDGTAKAGLLVEH